MKPELSARLEKLKHPTLLRMWEYKGPYELVNWWEHFIKSIPKEADFDDLDKQKQDLIICWEEDISAKESFSDKNSMNQRHCEE